MKRSTTITGTLILRTAPSSFMRILTALTILQRAISPCTTTSMAEETQRLVQGHYDTITAVPTTQPRAITHCLTTTQGKMSPTVPPLSTRILPAMTTWQSVNGP